MTRSARDRALAKSAWKTRRQEVAERGSKIAQIRRFELRRTNAGERLTDCRRMMRKVVVDGHAARRPSMLQPAANALEASERRRHRVGAQSNRRADGDRGERIAHVVGAQERHLEAPCGNSASSDPKGRRRAAHNQIMGLPIRPVRQAERFDPTVCACPQGHRVGVIGPEEEEATARDEIDEPLERQPDRVKIRVDVGVVELDVPDNGDVGQAFEELRGLVKERAVVFIALDDELAAAADAIARIEVLGDAAHEHTRVGAAVGQQPARQCGRCRLAMRAGNDDRSSGPEEMIADGFRQRTVPESSDRGLLRAPGCHARWRSPPQPDRDRR